VEGACSGGGGRKTGTRYATEGIAGPLSVNHHEKGGRGHVMFANHVQPKKEKNKFTLKGVKSGERT